MSSSTITPARPSHAELEHMLAAPDLTRTERRELQRMARFQKRVETWEERRSRPAPRRLHRAVLTVLMMAGLLVVLFLLLSGPPTMTGDAGSARPGAATR